MNKFILSIVMVAVGLTGGYFIAQTSSNRGAQAPEQKKVLYWVAPMDDNFRRDKPGQSPMGMDLVPVYAEPAKKEKEILYWVAPMDDNFRRDKPGQSPMGMELVPVYADDSDGQKSAGQVRINANVENNIGVVSQNVTFEPLQQQIDTVGYVSFDQGKLWHVYPRVEGWVENLSVSAQGDKVAEGAELFSIYSPTLVNAQEEFLTALKRGSIKIIESSKNRLLSLGISQGQIARVQKQRKVEQLVTIFAQFDGHITDLNIREGQYIRPQDKVMSLGNIGTVWVMTEIFERQAAWLSMGLPATMTTEHMPGKQWQGKIDHIHPFLNAKTRTMRVRLHFDNSDEVLKPNMFVKVTIGSNSTESVISIPSQALIRTGKQDRVVLSLGEGTYRSVAVVAGRQAGEKIEIVKGLKTGDRIVTSAQFLLDSESSKTADFSRMEVMDRSSGRQGDK